MMYSSQVWQDDGHSLGAEVTICKFMELYVRAKGVKVKTAEARDAAFLSAYLPEAHEIEFLIEVLDAAQAADLKLLLFKQRKRSTDTERIQRSNT
jgi:hypothetical protein